VLRVVDRRFLPLLGTAGRVLLELAGGAEHVAAVLPGAVLEAAGGQDEPQVGSLVQIQGWEIMAPNGRQVVAVIEARRIAAAGVDTTCREMLET